jgi:hypothetical protein
MNGFREEQARFEGNQAFAGPGRFRTFGEAGPVYEILEQSGDRLRIRIVETGEEAEYDADDAVQDPVA